MNQADSHEVSDSQPGSKLQKLCRDETEQADNSVLQYADLITTDSY